MKVWCVIEDLGLGGDSLRGVFSSEGNAKELVSALPRAPYYYEIEEFEVDSELQQR